MIDLSTVITELLFERDAVIVPGLGTFVRHDDGAKVNVFTNRFEPPSSTILFDSRPCEENDLLYKAIEVNEGCSPEDSRRMVSQFVSDCFEDLKRGGVVTLPGLGTLSMDSDETVTFEQEQGANFNGDAFGLGDFNPTPVHDSRADNDWRSQVIRQNKEKNTPMTVDRKAMDSDDDEYDYDRRRKRRVVYWLCTVLFAIPVILLLLHFLEVIHLDALFRGKPDAPVIATSTVPEKTPVDSALAAMLVRYDVMPVRETTKDIEKDTTTPAEEPIATVNTETTEPPVEEPVAIQNPQASKPLKYSIIGGFFSQKENAENLAASLREQGYADADVMPRGGQFYVYYARFATMEEAKTMLGQIRGQSNNKAWILDK